MSDENYDDVTEMNEEQNETINETDQNVTQEPEVSEASEVSEEQSKEEAWQRIDEENEFSPIPAKAHIKMKQKLKGRISERDDEIEKLKSKIQNLESNIPQRSISKLTRPKEFEYDSDEAYQQALSKYEDDLITSKFHELERKRQQENAFKSHNQFLIQAVEDHYERASKLIEKAGISPEIYRESDLAVRQAVNSIAPGRGDIIVDQMIANIGKGSDKVMFYLGINKGALHTFKSLLSEDPSGIKASIYLGQQKEKLTAPQKIKSRAPSPSPTANGDANLSVNSSALQKKYNEAHKKGNSQLAWKFRKEARLSGVDTSKW